MDFHTMQRKSLQSLCKKHNIPANGKTSQLADLLASHLKKPEEESKAKKGSDLEKSEEEPKSRRIRKTSEMKDRVASHLEKPEEEKKSKKVSFNQVVEISEVPGRSTRSRRASEVELVSLGTTVSNKRKRGVVDGEIKPSVVQSVEKRGSRRGGVEKENSVNLGQNRDRDVVSNGSEEIDSRVTRASRNLNRKENGSSSVKTRRGVKGKGNSEDVVGKVTVDVITTRETRSRKGGTLQGDIDENSQIDHVLETKANASRRSNRNAAKSVGGENESLSSEKVDEPEIEKGVRKKAKVAKEPENAQRRMRRTVVTNEVSDVRADVAVAEKGVSRMKTRRGMNDSQNNEENIGTLAVSETNTRETRSQKRGTTQGDSSVNSQIAEEGSGNAFAPENVSRRPTRYTSRVDKKNQSMSKEKIDQPPANKIQEASKEIKITKEPEKATRRSTRKGLANVASLSEEKQRNDVIAADGEKREGKPVSTETEEIGIRAARSSRNRRVFSNELDMNHKKNDVSLMKTERELKNNQDNEVSLVVSKISTRETRSRKRGDSQGDIDGKSQIEHAKAPELNVSRRSNRNASKIVKEDESLSNEKVDEPEIEIRVSKKAKIVKEPENAQRRSRRTVLSNDVSDDHGRADIAVAENLISPRRTRRDLKDIQNNERGIGSLSVSSAITRETRSRKRGDSPGDKAINSKNAEEGTKDAPAPEESASRKLTRNTSRIDKKSESLSKKEVDQPGNGIQEVGKRNRISKEPEKASSRSTRKVSTNGDPHLEEQVKTKAMSAENVSDERVPVNTNPQGTKQSRRVPETNLVSCLSNGRTMCTPESLPRSSRRQSSIKEQEASTGAKRKQKSQSIVEETLKTSKRSSSRHVSVALESEVAVSDEVSQNKALDDDTNQTDGKSVEDNTIGTNLEVNLSVADDSNDQIQVNANDKPDVGKALEICTESPRAASPENNLVGGESENLFLGVPVDACENTLSVHNNESEETEIDLHELEEDSHQHSQIECSLDDGHLAPNGSPQCYSTNGFLNCSELSSCNELNKSEQAEELLVGVMDNPIEGSSKKSVLEPVRRIQEDVVEKLQPSAEFDRESIDGSLILKRQEITVENTEQFSLGNSDNNTQQQYVDVFSEVSEKEGFIGNSSNECDEEHVNAACSLTLPESPLLPRKSSTSEAPYCYESSDMKPLKQVQKELVHSRKEVVTDAGRNSDNVSKDCISGSVSSEMDLTCGYTYIETKENFVEEVVMSLLSRKSLVEVNHPSDSGCIASVPGVKEPCEPERENASNSPFHTSEATVEDGSSSQGYKMTNSSLVNYELSTFEISTFCGHNNGNTGVFNETSASVERSDKRGDRESVPGDNFDDTIQFSERSSEELECRAAYDISIAQASPCVGVGVGVEESKVIVDSMDPKEFLGVEENVSTLQLDEEVAIGFYASGPGIEEPCDSGKNDAGTSPLCSFGTSQENDSRSSGVVVSEFDDPATVGLKESKATDNSMNQEEILNVERSVDISRRNMEEHDDQKIQIVENEEVANRFHVSGQVIQESWDIGKENAGISPLCSSQTPRVEVPINPDDVVSEFDDHVAVHFEELKCTEDSMDSKDILDVESSIGALQHSMQELDEPRNQLAEDANRFDASDQVIEESHDVGRENASPLGSSESSRESDSRGPGDKEFIADVSDSIMSKSDHGSGADDLMFAERRVDQIVDVANAEGNVATRQYDVVESSGKEKHMRPSDEEGISGDDTPRNATGSHSCSHFQLQNEVDNDLMFTERRVDQVDDVANAEGNFATPQDDVSVSIMSNSDHGSGADDLMFAERRVDQVDDVANVEGNVATPLCDVVESSGKEKHMRQSDEEGISGADTPRNATGFHSFCSHFQLQNEVANDFMFTERRVDQVDDVANAEGNVGTPQHDISDSIMSKSDHGSGADDLMLTERRVDQVDDVANAEGNVVTPQHDIVKSSGKEKLMRQSNEAGISAEDASRNATGSPSYCSHFQLENEVANEGDGEYQDNTVDNVFTKWEASLLCGNNVEDDEGTLTHNRDRGDALEEMVTKAVGSDERSEDNSCNVDSTGTLGEADGNFSKSQQNLEDHDEHETQMVQKANDNDCLVSVDKPGEMEKGNEYIDTINQRDGAISREHSPEVATGSTSHGPGFPLKDELDIRGDDVSESEPFDDGFSAWDMDTLSENAGNDDPNFVGNDTLPNLRFEDIGNNVEEKDPRCSLKNGDPITLLTEVDNSGNNFVHKDGVTVSFSQAERNLPQNLEDQETRYRVHQAGDEDFSGEIEKDLHMLNQSQVDPPREEEVQTATDFPLCGSDFALDNAEVNQGEISLTAWEMNFFSGTNAQVEKTTFTEENSSSEKLLETTPSDPINQVTDSTSENANRTNSTSANGGRDFMGWI